MHHIPILALFSSVLRASAQKLASDPGVYGPPLDVVHVYNDQFPSGITVSATGRMFSNYPPALDANNTKYNVAELVSGNTETPYPSMEINSPPGGFINYTTTPPSGANYQDYLISVSSVVIDAKDRLWILDTGRALPPNGSLVLATFGGPKLICVDLSTNAVIQTIIFPTSVAYPDSYLNDVRFDLRSTITTSGLGVAYITDSSSEGRNGLITVDLGTCTSWRHLDSHPSVRGQPQFAPSIWGEPSYAISNGVLAYGSTASGSDGIALSADGSTLFWTAVGSAYLHSIPTALLRAHDSPFAELLAQAGIMSHGQKGTSDGLETDSNGLIYAGNFGQNAIDVFNPANGTATVFVRDPRIGWTDSFSVAMDGGLYFMENQLWRTKGHWPGTERRVRPYAVVFRVPLPGNGTKVLLM
ncbi:hypothetical protein MMC11_000304 [Xylographa trunciseda]|nr:hypothetical protein [Xylographa trunciseda]